VRPRLDPPSSPAVSGLPRQIALMTSDVREPPRAAPGWGKAHILAIGHSTRSFEEFLELLRSCGVETLADIRTIPRSRRNPQFEGEALARTLPPAGIRYVQLPKLGGLRPARRNSPNGAWRNASFRGYADYMQTGEFEEGLVELRALARVGKVAVMCAEAVPWRCHRSLLADALFARGVVVLHILGRGRTEAHHLTAFAVLDGRKVSYPPGAEEAGRQGPSLELDLARAGERPRSLEGRHR
jgi:hypothetical protein